MKVLTFRVWAPYAHFRRPYTTRSPATFSTPPRPTILGMIGAIIGYSKKDYAEKLKDLKIGIRPEGKIQKIRTTINMMDTKSSKMIQRTQMLHEFLSNPEYTIAVYCDDENCPERNILEKLYETISEQRPHYTPYLGTAQHIARIYGAKLVDQNEINEARTNYVAPIGAVLGAEENRTYIVERQAYHIDAERKATKYIDIAIPIGGQITVKRTENVIITDGGIVLW